MTHQEEIVKAVVALLGKDNTFTRKKVRQQIRISQKRWMAGYTAIFQGMREDHPKGAPKVGEKFKGMFQRIRHGNYRLTRYGRDLVNSFDVGQVKV